jgi:hypothetical protein
LSAGLARLAQAGNQVGTTAVGGGSSGESGFELTV